MSENFQRKEIGDGVFFNIITDSRYKLNRISINFFADLNENTASANAIVPRILVKSSQKYPSFALLNNKLSSLYAAHLNEIEGKQGDSQYIGLCGTSIDDAYALEGEKLTEEMTDIILECLFNPLCENGIFFEKSVELEKQSLIDDIEAEINDKVSYSRNKAYSILCKGEPSAIPASGTVEQTQKITPQSAFDAYCRLLSEAPVEIVCVGCNDFSGAERKLTEAFSKIKRTGIFSYGSQHSRLKPKVDEFVEKMPVTQSKMVLGFKTDFDNRAALTVMNSIFGGTTTSKLFVNVREKLSLCYYCWSSLNHEKGIMIVSSGVENTNIEKAKAEILLQFDNMKAGEFSDADIEHAVLSLENDLRSVSDSPKGLAGWYFAGIYRNDVKTPEAFIEQIRAVTRDEIVAAAKSISLDSIYVLTSQDEESETYE